MAPSTSPFGSVCRAPIPTIHQRPTTVAPQDVTLSANTPIGGATTYVLDDSGNMTSSSTELTNGSLSIAVTDRITLVALHLARVTRYYGQADDVMVLDRRLE